MQFKHVTLYMRITNLTLALVTVSEHVREQDQGGKSSNSSSLLTSGEKETSGRDITLGSVVLTIRKRIRLVSNTLLHVVNHTFCVFCCVHLQSNFHPICSGIYINALSIVPIGVYMNVNVCMCYIVYLRLE